MIDIQHLNVSYDEDIFIDASLSLESGLFNVLSGESGLGKTTLLSKLGLLLDVDFDYVIDGEAITKRNQLSWIRAEKIGYVFQENHLLEKLSVKDNLIFAAQLSGLELSEEEVDELLRLTHTTTLKDRAISTLSGGEKQRVAISFALAKSPLLLLLDEPTSFLDHDNCQQIVDIIKEIAHKGQSYVLVATHDLRMLNEADVIYHIDNYQITKEQRNAGVPVTHKILPRSKSLHKEALHHYIKESRQVINHMLSLLTMIILSLFLCIVSYRDYYRNDFVKNVINSSQEEVRLYYGPYQLKAADKVTGSITNNVRRQLMETDDIDRLVPFYEEEGQINNMFIAIQSYDDLSSQVDQMIDDKESVYVSYNLQKVIHNGSLTLQFEDRQVKLKVGGILDKNYRNDYSETSDYVVYLPYQDYTTILSTSTVLPKIYIVKFSKQINYVEFMDRVQLIDPELTLYSKVDLETLTLLNNSLLSSVNQFVLIFGICAIALIVYERFKSINNRRYEFGLQYANGCSMMDIIYMIERESLGLFSILVLTALGIATGISLLFLSLSAQRLLLLIFISIGAFVLLQLTSFVAGWLVLKRHSIVQLLFE